MNRLRELVATFFYTGYAPLAPGTVSAAVAAFFCLIVLLLAPPPLCWIILGGMIISALAGNAFSAGWAQKRFASADPPCMVIDEALGMFVSVFLIRTAYPLILVLGGLVLFRIFDITKPFPARRLEKTPGWLGIMLDDLAAGIYSNLVLRAGFICYNMLFG